MESQGVSMDDYCERCGEKLNPKTLVYLELSTKAGLFTDPDKVSLGAAESEGGENQGAFPFGKACARAVLANGGDCVRIGRLARE